MDDTIKTVIVNQDQLVNSLVDRICDINLWSTGLRVVVALVIVLLIKFLGESIVGYLRFRISQNIIKGTPVIVDGEMGRVKRVTLFTILIETNEGWMPIATRDWNTKKLVKLRDQCLSLDRRKRDKKS